MTISTSPLSSLAKDIIQQAQSESSGLPDSVDPTSNNHAANQRSISTAKRFLEVAAPSFLESDAARDEDRLVKIGRSMADLVRRKGEEEDGLTLLVASCRTLASSNLKVGVWSA